MPQLSLEVLILFSRLSNDDIDLERKRHDEAIEQLQKAQVE